VLSGKSIDIKGSGGISRGILDCFVRVRVGVSDGSGSSAMAIGYIISV
jgi:hypothetical protein